MSGTKIIPIGTQHRCTAGANSARIERMIVALDQLAPEEESMKPEYNAQDTETNGEAPRDFYGDSLRFGISDQHQLKPIVQSEAEWDHLAIEREDLFKRRFGFAWPRKQREQVIALKYERNLVDSEIQWLYRAGALRRRGSQVRFATNVLDAAVGFAMIGYLSLPMALLVLRLLIDPALSLQQAVQWAALMTMLVVVSSGAHRIFVKPWLIYRRPLC